MAQNTPFELLILGMGLLMMVQFAFFMIKRALIKGKEKKLRGLQLMTFVDQGYTNLFDDKGQDVLYLAATGEFADVTARAVEKGADPNRLYKGQPLLRILARKNPYDIGAARTLLKNGALPDGPEGLEVSPLWQCATSDHADLAKVLIDHGANINIQSPTSGMTPLMTAVYQQSVAVGRVLVNAGADLNIRDQKGRNTLDFTHKNKDMPVGPTGDSASSGETHGHEYNELIRQIKCVMAGKKYKYKKAKKNDQLMPEE